MTLCLRLGRGPASQPGEQSLARLRTPPSGMPKRARTTTPPSDSSSSELDVSHIRQMFAAQQLQKKHPDAHPDAAPSTGPAPAPEAGDAAPSGGDGTDGAPRVVGEPKRKLPKPTKAAIPKDNIPNAPKATPKGPKPKPSKHKAAAPPTPPKANADGKMTFVGTVNIHSIPRPVPALPEPKALPAIEAMPPSPFPAGPPPATPGGALFVGRGRMPMTTPPPTRSAITVILPPWVKMWTCWACNNLLCA